MEYLKSETVQGENLYYFRLIQPLEPAVICMWQDIDAVIGNYLHIKVNIQESKANSVIVPYLQVKYLRVA